MRTLAFMTICAALLVTAANTLSAGDNQAADAALEDLAWLGGYWTSDKRGVLMEECWLTPHGHVMVGVHRDYYEDGRTTFEYLRIMKTGEGIVYYASPGGIKTTKFKLTGLSITDAVKEATFENPENEFPTLIRYILDGEGLMASIEGFEDDVKVVSTWVWKRASLPVTTDSR